MKKLIMALMIVLISFNISAQTTVELKISDLSTDSIKYVTINGVDYLSDSVSYNYTSFGCLYKFCIFHKNMTANSLHRAYFTSFNFQPFWHILNGDNGDNPYNCQDDLIGWFDTNGVIANISY